MTANYEDQVISSIKDGMATAGLSMDKKMELLFRLVYKSGYNEASRDCNLLNVSTMSKH